MRAFRAFSQANTDKGYVHGYDRFYDEIFKDYTPDSLLEVGIKCGHSLAAWRIMFPNCDISGIDITDNEFSKKKINFAQAKIIIGDATKKETTDKLEKNYDVIIDDGSHYYKDIIKTFQNLNTKFNRYYIIEDWHYDTDIARKFLNNYGFNKVSFHLSNRSRLQIEERRIFKSKKKNLIKINQIMIIIER